MPIFPADFVALLRSSRRWVAPLVVWSLVEFVYVFVSSAGHFARPWPGYLSFYDLLADGFRAGHLYLPISPPPELLAQDNPLDSSNVDLWMWDAAFYQGKYFVYWGPVPAVLLAVAKIVFRIDGGIGDQYLVFAFSSTSALCGILLIDRIARRLFGRVPWPLTALTMLAMAFGSPALHLLATGGTYQAAIAGGQAFVLAGLLFAFDAVWEAESRNRRQLRLCLAGIAWMLAFATRLSLAPAVVLLAAATVLATGTNAGRRWRQLALDAAWLTAPLAMGVAVLLAYNKLRFDEWLVFGLKYQMTTYPFRLSLRYLIPNAYSYLLGPMNFTCRFPFITQIWDLGFKAMPEWLRPSGYLISEPVAGYLRTFPFAWLGLAALLARRSAPRGTALARVARDRTLVWCGACFAVLASVTSLGYVTLFTPTIRYQDDMFYGAALLGVLGCHVLYDRARPLAARIAATAIPCVLGLASIGFGLLYGYEGYGLHFKYNNPELDRELVERLSLCQKN